MHAPSCYETRHRGGDALATHRHRQAYAALVVHGAHWETSIDGPVLCEPGTLLLHPRFHAHGNRFLPGGAQVMNIALGAAAPDRAMAYRVDPRIALGLLRSGHAGDLMAYAAASEPVEREAEDGWQAEMLRELRGSDAPVARIAARLGVSAAHASRALTRRYGMGPRALRRELRWRHALTLLHGGAPLVEVAALAGFADQSHFNRVARDCSGATPLQLRRQIKFIQDGAPALAS